MAVNTKKDTLIGATEVQIGFMSVIIVEILLIQARINIAQIVVVKWTR